MPKITVTLWCTPAVLDRLIGVDDALGVQRTNRPPKPAWEMPYPILTTWRRKAQGVREGNLLPPKKWRDLKNPWVEMLRMEWQSRDLIAQPILPTMHCGSERPDDGTPNHSLFRQLGSERVSQRANEWAEQTAWAKPAVWSQPMSEQGDKRANGCGPVLMSQSFDVLHHNAVIMGKLS